MKVFALNEESHFFRGGNVKKAGVEGCLKKLERKAAEAESVWLGEADVENPAEEIRRLREERQELRELILEAVE